MTDKEIIQALRICATHIEKGCGLCPQMKYVRCTERLADEAITMIERLTAENTALREGASLGKVKRPQKIAYEKSIEFLRAVTDGQSDEIKSLRRELEWKDMVIALAQREQAKAEAERDTLREKVPRWISVDERHPKPGTRVLATDGVFVGEAYRTSADTWRRYDGVAMRDCIGSVVTHWMPLAEASEGGEKA
jgi:hypothetical protein